jgi:hypothetical protein
MSKLFVHLLQQKGLGSAEKSSKKGVKKNKRKEKPRPQAVKGHSPH